MIACNCSTRKCSSSNC